MEIQKTSTNYEREIERAKRGVERRWETLEARDRVRQLKTQLEHEKTSDGIYERRERQWETKTVEEKLQRIRHKGTRYVPKLPLAIDAMYENRGAPGNFSFGYLDPDPVKQDPVYKKLHIMAQENPGRGGFPSYPSYPNTAQKVAIHYRDDAKARVMNEKTYTHILKTSPQKLLKEFVLTFERNEGLRAKMQKRGRYYRGDTTEWLDVEN